MLDVKQDVAGKVQIAGYEADRYSMRTQLASASLLRIAVPFFPGWGARIDGRSVPVVRVDRALSGVVVPAGAHDVEFRYRSTWFAAGAVVSCLSWLGIGWVLFSSSRYRAAA